MATLYNMGHQNFKWRKQLRSCCLIEVQQISLIFATVAKTRHRSIVVVPRLIGQAVQVNREQGADSLGRLPKIQRIRLWLVVFSLLQHENQVKTKHVESALVPRLDEGSTPSSSTMYTGHSPADTRQNQDKPRNISILRGFLVSIPYRLRTDSGHKKDRTRPLLVANQWQRFPSHQIATVVPPEAL